MFSIGLFYLYFSLHILYRVTGFHLQSDGFTSQGFDKYLHLILCLNLCNIYRYLDHR